MDGHPLLVTSRNKHAARLRCRLSKPWHAGRRSFRKSCRHDWREEPRLQVSLKTRRHPPVPPLTQYHGAAAARARARRRRRRLGRTDAHVGLHWAHTCTASRSTFNQPQAMVIEASIQVVLLFYNNSDAPSEEASSLTSDKGQGTKTGHQAQ